MVIDAIFWLIAMIVLLGIEVATLGLTTIWFAGGCLAAFAASLLGAGTAAQILVFFVVSLVLLFVTRPIAVKYFNRERTRTNVDSLIGRTAVVTQDIDNLKGTGAAVVNGQTWTARAREDGQKLAEGTVVKICSISGVKLIVEETLNSENKEKTEETA